jgi:hypothetical protein
MVCQADSLYENRRPQLVISYTVPVATTTTLVSSSNPSAYGDTVTFTAKVNKTGATGTVDFFDGATLLGSGTLANVGGQKRLLIPPATQLMLLPPPTPSPQFITATAAIPAAPLRYYQV